MVASNATMNEVIKVIITHVTPEQLQDILIDLQHIKGNQSFCDTIQGLLKFNTEAIASLGK
jgi:hypothetical protein